MASRRLIGTAAAAALLYSCLGPTPTAMAAAVTIPDPGFAHCLRRTTGAAQLTTGALAALERVECSPALDGAILDLTGAVHLSSVTTLRVSSAGLEDLTPLSELTTLRSVLLETAPSADLTPLASLPSLAYLSLTTTDAHDLGSLGEVSVKDLDLNSRSKRIAARIEAPRNLETLQITGALTSLAGLPQSSTLWVTIAGDDLTDLTGLEGVQTRYLTLDAPRAHDLGALGRADLTDYVHLKRLPLDRPAPLGQLDKVSILVIEDSVLTDLTPLTEMASLRTLRLDSPKVADLSPLGASLSLRQLYSRGPHLTSLGPPGTFKRLEAIGISGSRITSVDALKGAPLKAAELGWNELSDISGLADAVDGARIDLSSNHLHDFSPLAGWKGELSAKYQSVTLPRVLEDTPFPIRLLDEHGKPLLGDFDISGATYRDGMLTSLGNGPVSLWLHSKSGAIETHVWQDVTPGREFTKAPRPQLPAGTLRVGRAMTAKTPGWSPQPSYFEYQWYRQDQWDRGGQPIPGAVRASYTPTGADRGRRISVVVTAHRPGYSPTSNNSFPLRKVATGSFSRTPAPKIRGTRAVGSKLTATLAWSPMPSTTTYQWYRNGSRIKKATRASYTLTAADRGKRIAVKVTGKRSGLHTASRTSTKTGKITAGTIVAPSVGISGTPAVGSTLTAARGTWRPGGVKYTYRWYRDGKVIPKATAKTYRVRSGDAGHLIHARVTGSKKGYIAVRRYTPKVTIG